MTTWDGIDEFMAVATAGSFVGGSRALGASTSYVSRAVMALENRLGVPLFFRTTRNVTLTDAGRTLLERLRRISEERDEVFALLNDEGGPQGELRLTCSITLGERFVAPIVRRFAEKNPQLAVHLDLTNRLVDLVAEGYDLALRTGFLADSQLVATRIASRRLHVCASPAYLARAGRPESLEQLSKHQCLVGTAAQWHFRIDGKEQPFRPQGRWRCNNGAVILDAALAGMGVCQLPDFYVMPYLRSGQLEALLRQFQIDDEPIWAVYPNRRNLPSKVRHLVAQLKDGLDVALKGESIPLLRAG